MRAYDIIDKKKKNIELSEEEIKFMVEKYVEGVIPDYQMSAFLMAVYFNSMSDKELVILTDSMAKSGDMVDLSQIKGIKVDKHSTGGVGDKTTLVVAPIVAACGGKIAKMSGRGLGFTGGTIDKLESIPGFRTGINGKEFFEIVNKIGVSVIGQSADIAPADKKMYALRDVTATVDSIPLIAASIMSKKLASGSDKIVLDVTVGSGAFMKNKESALELAKKMVAIGEGAGRETVAILTNMDEPLGYAVGNIIEVKEAIDTLNGKGPDDFIEICETFSAHMIYLAGIADNIDEAQIMIKKVIDDGSALNTLASMVKLQGGDESYIYDYNKFESAKIKKELKAQQDGYVYAMNTEMCGEASVVLGAGRETKESEIDMSAGIYFIKKTGDKVIKGDTLAYIYSSDDLKAENGLKCLNEAYTISEDKPELPDTILAYVTKKDL